ncbi:MAG TPA: alkaline phosphatase family protein [Polyangiales bacterium]|nr:alkaline phosphatase family protein [Polyangiales bacterium]
MQLRSARRLLLAVLPLFLGLAALYAFDLSDSVDPPRVTQLEAAPHERLFVVMIDSFDRRDVQALPRLQAHLPSAGLHGRVRACVDGVTIPCVSAMVSGVDRASGFSPLRNFGAARALSDRSLLGALQRRGRRVGYFGDPLLARALAGLEVVYAAEHAGPADDDDTLEHALGAANLDLVFIHLLALDETAHKFGAEGDDYARALQGTDARIDRVFAARSERDHVVVLGDHGHEPSGRHSADVGTDTFAAYFGPRFARHLEHELVMTDHAAIWARVFGLRWGESGLADAYFAGAPLAGDLLASRARSRTPLLVACLLALAMATQVPRAAMLSGAAVMFGFAVLFRGVYGELASVAGSLLSAVAVGVVGAGVLAVASRQLSLATLCTGSLLFALPTAEPTAGLKAPVLWLLILLCTRLRHAKQPLQLALSIVLLLALALIRVRDYLPRSLLEVDIGPVGFALAALPMAIAAYAAGGRLPALAVALGELIVACAQNQDARWWIAPCGLVLPLSFAAFRWRRAFALTCLLLPMACSAFFPHQTAQLAAVATSWLLWVWLSAALRDESTWLRASTFVLLMWLSFWTAMSTRVGGVDYDFYFRWLPANEGATGEAGWQGLLTAAKCMLPVVFGALLAFRAGVLPRAIIEAAEQLTRARLALAIVFVAGLSWTSAPVNVQWTYDATQEIAFWILMFAVLGLLAAAHTGENTQPK